MYRLSTVLVLLGGLSLAGCSAAPKPPEAKLFGAGDKAKVGSLTYSLVDSQIMQQLGDDAANPRMPQNRFILVQVSVTNGGNEEVSIPGMTLVDDGGQTYNELADGTGVQRWLGVLRKVGPAQTEAGMILFDAPAKHYKLKLTDEFANEDVSIDMPLSFIHEQMQHIDPTPADAPK